jgi:hypothetical protein
VATQPNTDPYAATAIQAGADPYAATAINASSPSGPQTATQRLFGIHPLDDALSVVGSHLKNFVAGPYHAFADAPQTPEEEQIKGTKLGSSAAANALGQFGLGAARLLVQPTRTALRQAVTQYQSGNIGPHSDYDEQGNYHPSAVSSAIDAIPVAGPWSRQIENDARKHGAVPALLGAGTDLAVPVAGGKLLGAVGDVPGAVRRSLTSEADTTIPGTLTTPRLRYQAAQRVGANLDAADATGSPILQTVKRLNENSLTAAPTYEATKAANVKAVGNATDSLLDQMSPLDRESGGSLLRSRLTNDMQGIQNRAASGYTDLDNIVGNQAMDTSGINAAARAIQDETKAHYEAFPSLKPSKVASVVDDAANFGVPQPAKPVMSGLVDESGAPIPSSAPQRLPVPMFSGLQKLRSNLIDYTRNNPEIVKDSTGAQLQRLTGATDESMMAAGSRLPADAKPVFRQANKDWAEMKDRYDNPQSPYYRAVRNADPSTLPTTLGPKTPEFIRDISGRVGPEGVGVLQRGAAENALGTTGGGDYNFQTFPRKLRQLPEEYAGELFGPHALRLNDIADTAHALNRDFNPSGSGKLLLKGGELGEAARSILPALSGRPNELLSNIAYHGAQYGTAKLLNSPSVVKWLMKDDPLPSRLPETYPTNATRALRRLAPPLSVGPQSSSRFRRLGEDQ